MAPRSILDPSLRGATVGAVALISLAAFESLAVATAMPVAARALDGTALYPVAFGATLAASVVGLVLAGGVADRRGPATPMRWGVGLFAAGLVAAGLAPTMELLTAGRLLQGLGIGMFEVAVYVVVGRRYPPELRPRMFAALSAAWVVPAIVGPPIAGAVTETVGWRWVFLLVAGGVLAVARLVVPAAPPEPDDPGAPAAPTARIAAAVAAATSVMALGLASRTDGPLALLLVVGAAAGVVMCARRLLPTGTLRGRPGVPATVGLRGLASASFFGTETYLPLLLVRERGLAPATAGLILVASAISWSIGSGLVGRLSPARLRRARLRGGMVLIAVGVAVAGSLLADGVPVVVGMAGWAVAGLGMGIVYPTLSVLVLEQSPSGRQGEHSSALQLTDALTTATMLAGGGLVFAALLAAGDDVAAFATAFGFAGAAALAGVLLAGRATGRPVSPPARAGARAPTSPGSSGSW